MRFVLLTLLGLFWSLRLVAMKAAGISGIPADVLVTVAVCGLAILFSLVAIWRYRLPPMTSDGLRFYTLSGAVGFVAPFFLESLIAPHLPVFVLATIIATMPLLTLGLAAFMRTESLETRSVLASILGFGAIVLLLVDMTGGTSGETAFIWLAAAFGIPLLYAANTVYVASRWPEVTDALDVALAQAVVVSLAAAAGWIAFGNGSRLVMASLNWTAVGVLVLCEGAALFLYLHITRRSGASFVALANYLSILFAALLGQWLFDDRLTILSIIAAFILICALTLRRRKT